MKINGIEIKGDHFAFDGCHKIYIIETLQDMAQAQKTDYQIVPICELEDTWMHSCPLRFINTWSCKSIVPQGTPKYSVKFEL